jgi:hypothetical protein
MITTQRTHKVACFVDATVHDWLVAQSRATGRTVMQIVEEKLVTAHADRDGPMPRPVLKTGEIA